MADKAIERIRARESEYWEERFRLLEEARQRPLADFISNMEARYDKALESIEAKISLFIRRCAEGEAVSYAEAQKLLTDPELRTFKMGLEEYIKYGRRNAEHFDATVAKELERASLRYRVTRLEALKYQIKAEVARLCAQDSKEEYELLAKAYRDEYARTAFEIFKGCGVVDTDFTVPEWDAVDAILREPWAADGMSFMQKSGGYSRQLMSKMEDALSKMMVMGSGYWETAREIRKSMKGLDGAGGAMYKAKRLISTEAAFFGCEAQRQCFKRLGVERYQFRTELNTRVCPNCADLDGEVFELRTRRIGVNYPPMHPFCRCIAIPYIDNSNVPGYAREYRNGRDENGKSVLFPANMTFKQWYKEVGEELERRQAEAAKA